MNAAPKTTAGDFERRLRDFDRALSDLEATRPFGKLRHQRRALAQAERLIADPRGPAALYERAPRFDAAGLFQGGDWDSPQSLQSSLVRGTLLGGGENATTEALSELRMLAIAAGDGASETLDGASARQFLDEVLASNLDILFPTATEAARYGYAAAPPWLQPLFRFLLERLGAAGIMESLVFEVERVLLQRPIMIQRAESLLHAAARALGETANDETEAARLARYWIGALQGPSALAAGRDADDYATRLADLDAGALEEEARTFGATMNATGLVSPQHAALLTHLLEHAPHLLGEALALGPVGRVSLTRHETLIAGIVRFAIRPETARSIYGLARLLDRGTLFVPPVPPGLQRLMHLPIHPQAAALLQTGSEWSDPPAAAVLLLAGTLSTLGQPRGVDQGDNPTCQAARAISLWAQNDPGYLLELIARAAREDELAIVFEGEAIHSGALESGLAESLDTELGPVSLLLTPHLDRIYAEMSRRTAGRGEDGHKWINPEYHGWWVYRDFAIAVDVATGGMRHFDDFVRCFYAAYHPLYNGGIGLVYAQPCGIASTNANAEFMGWHAVSIQRVAPDPEGVWRVYFFNPNRDKGQDWGGGIVTSTNDHGEYEGESSLPVEEFAMRLYVFHYKAREMGDPAAVPAETVAAIRAAVAASWGAGRPWHDAPEPGDD